MCVQAKGYRWERPAVVEDCPVIESYFPGVDYQGLLTAMSQDKALPLTTDLVLFGAMFHTPTDDLGMRYVPFTAIEKGNSVCVVKLPVMETIVDWFENTALGTDMWNHASNWCEKGYGMRVHFAMNCGCGLVDTSNYKNGVWTAWKERFNTSRAHLYGRTTVTIRETDGLENIDITESQLQMWHRIRNCLEAL
jgi:hypothetical protein